MVDSRSDATLEAFCRAQWPRLVGMLTAYTGDPHRAEDLAGETIVRVVRDWRRVRTMDAPGAWAHRVALNLAKGHFRRLGALFRARARGGEVHPHVQVDADAGEGVAVRRALAALPPRQREAVALRYVADLSLAEVASAMGISVGGVKSQVHAGLRAMRDALEDPTWRDSEPVAGGESTTMRRTVLRSAGGDANVR